MVFCVQTESYGRVDRISGDMTLTINDEKGGYYASPIEKLWHRAQI